MDLTHSIHELFPPSLRQKMVGLTAQTLRQRNNFFPEVAMNFIFLLDFVFYHLNVYFWLLVFF